MEINSISSRSFRSLVALGSNMLIKSVSISQIYKKEKTYPVTLDSKLRSYQYSLEGVKNRFFGEMGVQHCLVIFEKWGF